MRTLPLTLALLLASAGLASAQPLTDADLDGKTFMHRGTFAGDDGGGWARDDLELEGAFTVRCVPYRELYRLLRAGDNGEALRENLFTDDNRFRELRRQDVCEAFSIGYPIDEIPWDAERHAVREQSPYVWLTIESGNYDIDERRNRRVLSLGTDLMDDVYYDTNDFVLLRHRLTIRGRKRWDSGAEIRRLLIGTKHERGIDENGIKVAAKVDIRTDSPSPDDLLKLDDYVRSGLVGWDGQPEVATPCKELYERLTAVYDLPDTASFRDVLVLEPKVFLRSIRSRYHLNECRLQSVRELHELGRARLTALVAQARESRMDGAVPAAHVARVQAWELKAARVLDGTLVAERAGVDIAAVQSNLPTAPLLAEPETLAEIAAREPELKRRQVVAQAVSDLYHELARDLDDGSSESLRRVITRALDRTYEDHAAWYVAFHKARDAKTYGPITTFDKFVDLLRETIAKPDAEREADLDAYNAFGEQQRAAGRRPFRDFEPLPDDQLDALLRQLQNEQVRIWMRQVEAAGSAGLGLWFDQARAFYIPGSYRSSGNFLIDTMDFTTSYPMSVWDGVPPEERLPTVELPEGKIIHTTLVNELQIELTSVSAYTDRMRRLGGAFDHARAFMRWVSETQPGVDDATEYLDAFQKLAALPEAEQATKLAELNAYAAVNGLATTPLDAADFEALERSLLVPEVRDAAAPPADLQVALAGAKFVFEEYHRMQTYVSEIKGPGVLEVLSEAGGPACMEWVGITASKGETALTLLRDSLAASPTDGLAGAVTSPVAPPATAANGTKATALAVERKAYPEARLAAGQSHWFKLDLGAAEAASFRVRFEHDEGDVDLTLEREDGTVVSSSRGTGDTERVRHQATTPRTVWLRVFSKGGGATGAYVLTVE